MRREGADVRAEAVPVLLALRAGGGTLPEEGGLHRSRGRRSRSPGTPSSDGGISREGGAGARSATREGRADAGPPSDRPRVGTVARSAHSSNTGPTSSSRVPQMPAAVRRALSLSLVLLLLLVAGSLVVLVPPAAAAGQISVYMAGLNWPIALAFSSDGRIFFAERNTGSIRII